MKKTLNCAGVGEAVVIVDTEVASSVEVALTVLIVCERKISCHKVLHNKLTTHAGLQDSRGRSLKRGCYVSYTRSRWRYSGSPLHLNCVS